MRAASGATAGSAAMAKHRSTSTTISGQPQFPFNTRRYEMAEERESRGRDRDRAAKKKSTTA
jgi:hypothetical protein